MSIEPPERLEAYITRKGPVLVSGQNRVEILRSVIDRSDNNTKAVELCNVTADTKLPKSSIFSTLEDLVKKGVLKYGTVGGKKGYELDSYRILSTNSTLEQYDFSKDIIENAPKDYSFYRMLFNYMGSSSLSHGVDIRPLMKTVGYDFGKLVREMHGGIDESLKALQDWYSGAGSAEVRIVSRLPLTVEIQFIFKSITGELAKVFASYILSSIAAVIGGKNDVFVDSVETDGNKVTGVLVHSNVGMDRDIVPYDFSYDDNANAEFMLFVSSKGEFRSVDNPLGLAILEAMPENCPMSSAEITKSLKLPEKKPQSSVLFYLEKMIAAGLVEDLQILGKRKFKRVAGNMYTWADKGMGLSYDPSINLKSSLENPETAYEYVISASIRRLYSLRIAIEPVIGRLAESLAKRFCDMSEKKTIESVMSTITSRGEWFRFSETSVTSFVPFTFVRKLHPGTDVIVARTQLTFDSTFFKRIIHEITGADYVAECIEYNSVDSIGYKLVFQLQNH